jgi:SAM-dependent methyltransferase
MGTELVHAHQEARHLFESIALDYQAHSDRRVLDTCSLVFQRRIDIVRRLLSRIEVESPVLDFGMGPAVFAPYCVERGWRYIGMDIAPAMVERARSRDLPNVEVYVGDLDSLPGFAAKMGVVMAIGLVDYLEDPREGIRKLASCVEPHGYLVLSFRNRFSFPTKLRDLSRIFWRGLSFDARAKRSTAFVANVHERSFDFRTDLRPLLTRLGFSDFSVRYFNCSPIFFNFRLPRWLWQSWYWWDSHIAGPWTRPLCSGGVLLAQKTK